MKKKYTFAALCAMMLIIPLMTMIAQAADPTFGNVLFQNRWVEQDRLVGSAGVSRPYTWGPSVPEAPAARQEPYNSSPGGSRQVAHSRIVAKVKACSRQDGLQAHYVEVAEDHVRRRHPSSAKRCLQAGQCRLVGWTGGDHYGNAAP